MIFSFSKKLKFYTLISVNDFLKNKNYKVAQDDDIVEFSKRDCVLLLNISITGESWAYFSFIDANVELLERWNAKNYVFESIERMEEQIKRRLNILSNCKIMNNLGLL